MNARNVAMLMIVSASGVLLAGCTSDRRVVDEAGVAAAGDERDYRRDFRGQKGDQRREFCRQNPGDRQCLGRRF